MAELEKEKAIMITKILIDNEDSYLDTKYAKSHEKVAIKYKDHVVELIGGEEKTIKYLDLKVKLSKKEYKELYNQFMDVFKKRKSDYAQKKFDDLEHTIE
jgi:hypothetical protein